MVKAKTLFKFIYNQEHLFYELQKITFLQYYSENIFKLLIVLVVHD